MDFASWTHCICELVFVHKVYHAHLSEECIVPEHGSLAVTLT